MTNDQQQRLFKAVNEYSEREFGRPMFEHMSQIWGLIPFAYTTVGSNDQYECQSYFNFDEFQWEEYVNCELVATSKRDVEEFISEIRFCSFDAVISTAVEHALEIERKENSVNLNIVIDFDGKTLGVSKENSFGYRYKIKNKQQLLEQVVAYVMGCIDSENEFAFEIKRRK